MTYEEQLKVQQLNKEIINKIISTVDPNDFINFYKVHTRPETKEYFGIRTDKQLIKILQLFNYDFSFRKSLKKGKPSDRSHESYVSGGKKSAATQKQHWQEKSEEEKEAWSIKQSLAHLNSPTFKDKIALSNRVYRASLTEEQRAEMDRARSESMKAYWDNLSEEEKNNLLIKNNGQSKIYSQRDSKTNLSFKNKLEVLGLVENVDFRREVSYDRKLFDFILWDKIAIEIDPSFTHNSTWTPFEYNKPLEKTYHRVKSEVANKYGLRCIHIFDWDCCDKVLNLISKTKTTVYARNCEIKEVDKDLAKTFINENHLQNYARDSIRIGLFYKDELVSIMTFGKPRYNKNYEYELIRYCSKYNIIGGSEKIFDYFIKTYLPKSIISYCDKSKFNGETYNKLGFSLLKINSPSKHWYNMKTKEHYLDSLVRQQGFSRLVHNCEAKDDKLATNNNKELLINAGFVEVYDCGQAVYIWQK